jgi:hypothetical protein
MRFMIMVRATPMTERGEFPPDKEQLFASMADYHEQLVKAGVLLDGSGLQPSSKGWRIRYEKDGKRTVVDGPFAEAKELIAGYTLIQVRSREEALEWARRFPAPMGQLGGEIEVRQLYELEDFASDLSEQSVERFREIGAAAPQ